ncbi:MAG: RluA family pseudouridine synthase [Lachnospiraceae bacterium]|nr:RluA family pseudouridine synthase [Lachnospiraceae bacterium]
MRQYTVDTSEEGRRLDHVLAGILPKASPVFFHKMLRKKNIVINGHRQDGAYRVLAGDVITMFLSEETVSKFQVSSGEQEDRLSRFRRAYETLRGDGGAEITILFEDDDLLLLNKPAGILSQRAAGDMLSVNEWLCGYLLSTGTIDAGTFARHRPSVANRLDRGTSGLMVCVKTLPAARDFAALLQGGGLRKDYLAIVSGCVGEAFAATKAIVRDSATNTVTLREENTASGEEVRERMRAHPLYVNRAEQVSMLRLTLLEGKTHQLRAQLADKGFPVLGDAKYGDPARNREMRQRFGLRTQLLHSESLTFPKEVTGSLKAMSGRRFQAPLPEIFCRVQDAFFDPEDETGGAGR